MNIKSLLLGSAAALAVVSGAQAADAIVAAEPEPMEYVRVCDAFGTGYFYIPGTETCIKIGGRVRFDVQAANSYKADSDNGWATNSRAELYMSTASDTEFGALKTNITARWDWKTTPSSTTGSNTNPRVMQANINIAGFTIGLADTQYSKYLGYAGDIINDDVIEYGTKSRDEQNQISYLYEGSNGFSFVASLEDRGNDNGPNEYLPNLVAGAGYKVDAFSFKVVGGYDAIVEEGAVKARLDANIGSVSAFLMGAWNTDGDEKNNYAQWEGDWALWGGLGAQLTDDLKANVQLAYDDGDTFAAAANLKWSGISGLLIQPEVTYTKWDNATVDDDQWNGMVRFQRTF